MKRLSFETNHTYHIFNRGVDKRVIFNDSKDYLRFKQILRELNTVDSSGGVYILRKGGKIFLENLDKRPLVEIVAYNLLSNHFHLVLKQLEENGISKFMQKIGTGYTIYFNEKNQRSGSLFQGKFKAVLVDSEQYFRHLVHYVNFNHVIHETETRPEYNSIQDYASESSNNKISDFKSLTPWFKNFEDFLTTSKDSIEYSKQIKNDKKNNNFIIEE